MNMDHNRPWAVYCYISPGVRYCMARFNSRADGETYLEFLNRKTPKELYPELVFEPNELKEQ